MKKISVLTNKKKYPIYIGDSLIKKIDKILIKERLFSNNCLIIYDSKVVGDNLKIIKNKSPYKKKFYLKFVASEENKNLEFVNKIIEILLKNNFSRNDCIIAVGGGILGDIACFTASIYKRGIKFINIPTTLLAQVDASIGGKSGVNHKLYGKNLIGTFYQPDIVISDTSFLNTLKNREIICGYAEILKHSLISSLKNFKYSIANSSSNNGNLGWLNVKSLSKNIYDILKGLEIGDISDPIKNQDSILFLKLNDKRISKSENIDKNKLRQNLVNQRKNKLFNLYSRSYLSKLKNTSFIQYK